MPFWLLPARPKEIFQDMLIIDAHAHIFPDKIAGSASAGIGQFYGMPVEYDGTVETLFAAGKREGVSHFVVQSVATVPQQVSGINRFIAEQMRLHPGRLTGLGTLHPASADIGTDFDQIVRLGLKGVKLHPDFQRFRIDDPAVFPVYERAEGVLPLLIHTGDPRYDYSHPRRLLTVLKAFPKLTVIAAHLGGWSEWPDAVRLLAGKGVYVDTSSSLYALPPAEAAEIIRLFGPERVLFGTDYPMWEYGGEMKRFDRLELDETAREKILSGNAKALFSIEIEG
ncbi:MAG: amidohydrolase [Clostridiales bacterium]|nr:amidohydrolase [Clostridiales bacterium]